MSRRGLGGIIGTNTNISSSNTIGIFTMSDVYTYSGIGLWPGTESILLTALGNTAGPVTGTFSPTSTSVTVYGCAGGGHGGRLSPGDSFQTVGLGGGGGGASQLDGYELVTIAGETLSYSVGGPGQSTFIKRGSTTIFELLPGANVGFSTTGGAGGANNQYSSHAGGNGSNGAARYQSASDAAASNGCAGGGGGGGYGDNSPLTSGGAGGDGGAWAQYTGSNGLILEGNTTPTSGGGVGVKGGDRDYAIGGDTYTAGTIYSGGGGGAGSGLRIASLGGPYYYGAGGGGHGAGQLSNTNNRGGPGLLLIIV